jgi:solute carrier family 29 (equilibrative nucleoside transporter) protein 4
MIAYFVTLSLFPGVESEIKSCELGSWMPVILMAIFNFTDFCGKILASLCYRIGPSKLTLFSFLRIFLIPFLLLCAARPVPKHHFAAYVFTSLLGQILLYFIYNYMLFKCKKMFQSFS